MKRDDVVYLRHILDAITKVESYLDGVERHTFDATTLIQDGVIRQIEIIGEPTRYLSKDIRVEYSGVPWTDIAGMRDKLIHQYFGVDIERVWLTAKDDLPSLKGEVETILASLEG
jgi:uncharacterized protein with HEPN domain